MRFAAHRLRADDAALTNGADRCILVIMGAALVRAEAIRRSVSLPAEMAEKLDSIAAARHVSANRAIVDLLTGAITAYEPRTDSKNRPIRPNQSAFATNWQT